MLYIDNSRMFADIVDEHGNILYRHFSTIGLIYRDNYKTCINFSEYKRIGGQTITIISNIKAGSVYITIDKTYETFTEPTKMKYGRKYRGL